MFHFKKIPPFPGLEKCESVGWSAEPYQGCWISHDKSLPLGVASTFGSLYSRALLYSFSSLITVCVIEVKPITDLEIGYTTLMMMAAVMLSTATIGTFSAMFNQIDNEVF